MRSYGARADLLGGVSGLAALPAPAQQTTVTNQGIARIEIVLGIHQGPSGPIKT
jgi:hypothetical protein